MFARRLAADASHHEKRYLGPGVVRSAQLPSPLASRFFSAKLVPPSPPPLTPTGHWESYGAVAVSKQTPCALPSIVLFRTLVERNKR